MRFPLTVMKIRPFQFGKYDPISNSFGKVRVHHTRARRWRLNLICQLFLRKHSYPQIRASWKNLLCILRAP